MKENNLSFETEKLVVHWLEISIEGLYNLEEIQVLANYFDKKLEFNSTFRESAKRVSQSLISHPENKFNVLFFKLVLIIDRAQNLFFRMKMGLIFISWSHKRKLIGKS